MPRGAYGVVLVNLGAPRDSGSISGFMKSLLSDPCAVPLPAALRLPLARMVSARRARPVAEHYRAIGGPGHLLTQTGAQAAALASRLGGRVPVRFGFRHSPPFASDALASLSEGGVRRVIAVPMFPQFTRSTYGTVILSLKEAARRTRIQLRCTPSFPDSPGFIRALTEAFLPLLDGNTHLLLSAHGIPMATVRKGDPYVREVGRTVKAISEKLPEGTRCSLAFQSRVGRMAWTGPTVREEVARLGRQGVRRLVVVPLSFVCENLETLYELDIETAAAARAAGIKEFVRSAAPGCHEAFVDELAGQVRDSAWEWEDAHVD